MSPGIGDHQAAVVLVVEMSAGHRNQVQRSPGDELVNLEASGLIADGPRVAVEIDVSSGDGLLTERGEQDTLGTHAANELKLQAGALALEDLNPTFDDRHQVSAVERDLVEARFERIVLEAAVDATEAIGSRYAAQFEIGRDEAGAQGSRDGPGFRSPRSPLRWPAPRPGRSFVGESPRCSVDGMMPSCGSSRLTPKSQLGLG